MPKDGKMKNVMKLHQLVAVKAKELGMITIFMSQVLKFLLFFGQHQRVLPYLARSLLEDKNTLRRSKVCNVLIRMQSRPQMANSIAHNNFEPGPSLAVQHHCCLMIMQPEPVQLQYNFGKSDERRISLLTSTHSAL